VRVVTWNLRSSLGPAPRWRRPRAGVGRPGFAHEHPQIQPDGSFLLDFTFPRGGGFKFFHDFTPPRVGMQVAPVQLTALGETPPAVPPVLADGQVPDAGPDVVFSAQFLAPGLNKAWGQFQHRGHVITAPFVLDVLPRR